MSRTYQSETQCHFEVIQQWQYIGKVNPLLLTPSAFRNCKQFGITSVQSYVTWAQIEARQGQLDFSVYDELVKHLLEHNLKWVPFLILGPNYATPSWFHESDHCLHAICLEHQKASKIQSIWNPHLPHFVERFLQAFADHYSDHTIFESVSLGISGNWGEALYPATGGFLGSFHTHPGWWCGDKYARQNFRDHIAQKIGSITVLNRIWDTHLKDFSEVSFPDVGRSLAKDCFDMLRNTVPNVLKPILSRLNTLCEKIRVPLFPSGSDTHQILNSIRSPQNLQHWLDFTGWYQKAMTNWAQYWLAQARYYFPETALYLVTGGKGTPMLGADFSAQSKMAKKYGAGIRITNQNDDYRQTFSLTRLVAAACRNYGTYFTTEESGVNRPNGVTMRIFDAATSAARGAYFKSIIGNDSGPYSWQNWPIGEPTQGAKNLLENLHYISPEHPLIDVAVLFPNTTIKILPSVLNALYHQGGKFRAMVDFDFVDENMICDDMLANYRFFVLLVSGWIRDKTMQKIKHWITDGGILVTGSHLFLNCFDEKTEILHELLDKKRLFKRLHLGISVCIPATRYNYLNRISEAVYNLNHKYPWTGTLPIPHFLSGRYVTRFSNMLMSYDPNKNKIQTHRTENMSGTVYR